MINHTRTLLLNRVGDIDPDFPGEEYVPPDFQLRVVPTVISKLRQIVFGGDPDRYMLNYRLYQLLQVLHATELEEYVRTQDSRITYLPLRQTSLYKSAFLSTITPVGSFTGDLTLIGTLVPDETAGRLYHQWQVDVTTSALVRVKRLTPPRDEETFAYTLTEGRSSLVPLLGSSLQFNFSGPVGAEWFVEVVARPQRNMATLVADLDNGITEVDENNLFGVAPAEPQKTFRNLWRDHDSYGYRLGGLTLGWAYLMDQQKIA